MSYAKAKERYESQHSDEGEAAPVAHKCSAEGCPMAGSMADSSSSSTWWCAYHRACPPMDLPRVTSVLNQHKDLRDIVTDGRRLRTVHGNESTWPAEWRRMRELLSFGGYDDPRPDAVTFEAWLYAVETMLGKLVVEAMTSARRRAA